MKTEQCNTEKTQEERTLEKKQNPDVRYYVHYVNTSPIPKEEREKVKEDCIIYFKNEKKPYRVKALNDRYAICTQPHFGDWAYSIIDWERGIKVAPDRWHSIDFSTKKGCKAGLKKITKGEEDLSQINWVFLEIDRIKQ